MPIPGPTFDMADKVPDNDVIKSNPVKDNPKVQTIVDNEKIVKKDKTPNIISSVTGLSLYLGTTTACGETIKVKCLFSARDKMEKRKILMPPVVDPVHPPTAVKKKKSTTKNGPYKV